ncbi:MAG: alginate export family protein [Candidatus Omnitrophota bacterium]
MKKRLILILALTFVAAFAFAAYAEVQNVKVSGDITVLGLSRQLSLLPTIAQVRNEESAMASIARVRIDADLTDNVMTTVRLINERYWGNETNNTNDNANTDIQLDLAYVTLKEFLYSPLSLTIGRQELHFGNDMIVGDPDTNNAASTASNFSANNRDRDLSARKAFDAIRATLNYDPLVIDAIAAKITDTNLSTQDDRDLYGINANYKLGGKYDTVLEGYWFERRSGRRNALATTILTPKKVDRTDTIGARISLAPIESLKLDAEAAYQFGKYIPDTVGQDMHTVQRKAWAIETSATMDFKKAKYTPSLKMLYAYFSGDHRFGTYDTDMGAYKGWDPMFENQTTGHIFNALFNQTNAHVLGGAISMKPVEDITLKGEFYGYWWAQAPQDGTLVNTARDTATNLNLRQRRDIGQELDLTAIYDYTEDVQFSLMSGTFFPGGTFAKDNNSMASEVIGSMKVTF